MNWWNKAVLMHLWITGKIVLSLKAIFGSWLTLENYKIKSPNKPGHYLNGSNQINCKVIQIFLGKIVFVFEGLCLKETTTCSEPCRGRLGELQGCVLGSWMERQHSKNDQLQQIILTVSWNSNQNTNGGFERN